MFLKHIVRIDKSSLRSLIGKLMSYETPYRYILRRNKDACSSCEHNLWQEKLLAGIKKESKQPNPNVQKLSILQKELESHKEEYCKTCSACQYEKNTKTKKLHINITKNSMI